MPSIINATTTNGVAISPDNSGSLQLATNNGTTAVTIDTSQNVGIGTTSPNNVMTTYRGAGVNNYIQFTNATTGTASTDGCLIGVSADDTALRLRVLEAAPMLFTTSDTERMRINSSGQITMSAQPAFLVNRSSNVSVSTGSPIIFNSSTFNRGNHYNTSTGLFTAPVAGVYSFQVTVLLSLSEGTSAELSHAINSSGTYNIGRYVYKNGYTGYDDLMSLSSAISVYLNANDTFSIINNSTGSRTVLGSTGWCRFSGSLLG